MHPAFEGFPSITRLSRECVVTEKLDGTNAQIVIDEAGNVFAGSRSRWITPEDDNYGFARWVKEHEDELRVGLGIGQHFGEWWGAGIQRRYGLSEKRFSLFNVTRWFESGKPQGVIPSADPRIVRYQDPLPECCSLVPILYQGGFETYIADYQLQRLAETGSMAAPGFMDPEGIICWHMAANLGFKKTIKNDEQPKSKII